MQQGLDPDKCLDHMTKMQASGSPERRQIIIIITDDDDPDYDDGNDAQHGISIIFKCSCGRLALLPLQHQHQHRSLFELLLHHIVNIGNISNIGNIVNIVNVGNISNIGKIVNMGRFGRKITEQIDQLVEQQWLTSHRTGRGCGGGTNYL